MPRSSGLPLVGVVPQLLMNPFGTLETAMERHGSIFELDLGVTSVVVMAEPDAIEHVLLKQADNYVRGGAIWEGLREVLGRGLGASEGALWRRQRRLIQPSFQRGCLQGYRATIVETIEQQLDGLRAEGPVDVARWCDRLLATVSLRILFGSELDDSRVDELRATIATLSDSAIQGLITRKLPRWLPLASRRRLARARQVFDELATTLIEERRRNPGRGNDLLGRLLGAADEQGTMSDAQLLDEAITFYIAGYETTGTALAWQLWLLASHPSVRDALQAQLEHDDDPPLLRACIQEGLRLYPPAQFLIRQSVAPDELGGYPLRAKTTVLVSPWLLHRNQALWPDPERFDPQRFDPERSAGRPRLAWLPFGAGQRTCIGKALAMLELEEGLRRILRRFTPTVVEGRPVPQPRMSIALRASHGIHLHMQPR